MAAAMYTIEVNRGTDEGKLTFNHGSVSVNTTCWWDKDNKIDAGTYTGVATWMASKAEADGQACPWKGNKRYRPGIWFGDGVKSNNGSRVNNQIFIHKGTSAAWSDGCIVCAASEVLKIWNEITPKDTTNVSILVTDKVAVPSNFIVREPLRHKSPDYVRQAAQRHGFSLRTVANTSRSEIWTKPQGGGHWIIRLDTQGHGQWFHGRRPHYHKNWVASTATLHLYLVRFAPEAYVYSDDGTLIGLAPVAIHPEHLSKAQHIPR